MEPETKEVNDKRARLLALIKEKALFRGDFTLASGKKSKYYIDLRLVTLDSEGSYLIAEILYDMLKKRQIDAMGGLTMGADPICCSFAAVSYLKGRPTPAFIVRKEEKGYGKGKRIEGPLKAGSNVVIVDDVATTGGSMIKAVEAVEKEGCRVETIMCVVDRGEGAAEEITRRGYSFESIFDRSDLGLED